MKNVQKSKNHYNDCNRNHDDLKNRSSWDTDMFWQKMFWTSDNKYSNWTRDDNYQNPSYLMKNFIKASLLGNQLVKQIYTEKSQYDYYDLDKDKSFKGIYKFLQSQITNKTS